MTLYNVYSVINFVTVDLYLQYMHMESSDMQNFIILFIYLFYVIGVQFSFSVEGEHKRG
jgi:hypothetical protein